MKRALIIVGLVVGVGSLVGADVNFKKLYLDHMATHEKQTIVCLVLDESGSMDENRYGIITGLNKYINGLKEKAEKVLFTLTKFNTARVQTMYNSEPIKNVKEFNDETYKPMHGTPLYDAVGNAITQMKGHGPVLFVIMTDGEENSSMQYSRQEIFDLLVLKRKVGWTFVFLGADQDSWVQAQKIGVFRGNVMDFNRVDVNTVMGTTLLNATKGFISSGSMPTDTFILDFMEKDKEPIIITP